MRTLCLLALFTPSRVFLAPASVATPLRAMQPGRGFARLPLVSMVEIEGAGHGVTIQQQEKVNRHILNFLNEQ